MGLCLKVTEPGVKANITYPGYHCFLYLLVKACQGKEDADAYEVWSRRCLSDAVCPLPACFRGVLRQLLAHPDCEGELTPRQCEILLRLMNRNIRNYTAVIEYDIKDNDRGYYMFYYVSVMAVLGTAVVLKKNVRFN